MFPSQDRTGGRVTGRSCTRSDQFVDHDAQISERGMSVQ